jgi:hypothetical protein
MVQLPGMLPAPQPIGWCGSDSLGHPVPAGLYYIRVSIVDAGGSTQTTVTQVSNPGGCVTVTVYDASTGAKVLALYSGSYTSAPRAMTVDNTAFSIPGAVSVGLPGMVPAAPAIQWNGKGTNGQSVPAGDYTVRAEWKPLVYGETAQGQTLVKVLPSALGLGHAVLAPVPVRGGQPLCLYFAQPALASHWDVYAITGALVAHLDFGAGGQQCWDTAGIAPGIYFVRLVIDDAGGGKETRWQKVALH